MKGAILPDHMPINKYQLIVEGLPPILFTAIGSIEDELQTVDLPDNTTASGGNKNPVEFPGSVPAHHPEVYFLDAWFTEGQDPVSPTYKKIATLVLKSGTGLNLKPYPLTGLYISKRATPDLEMENDGEMAVIEYTFKGDQII